MSVMITLRSHLIYLCCAVLSRYDICDADVREAGMRVLIIAQTKQER